jgi:hypothetical protein
MKNVFISLLIFLALLAVFAGVLAAGAWLQQWAVTYNSVHFSPAHAGIQFLLASLPWMISGLAAGFGLRSRVTVAVSTAWTLGLASLLLIAAYLLIMVFWQKAYLVSLMPGLLQMVGFLGCLVWAARS